MMATMQARRGRRAVCAPALAALAALALLALVALAQAAPALAAPAPAAGRAAGAHTASQAAYQKAYTIGLAAYTYGLPLLDHGRDLPHHDEHQRLERRVRAGQPVQQRAQPEQRRQHGGGGAGGQRALVHRLARPPAEPQVLTCPWSQDHYFVLALIDPYTEDLANLGSVHDTEPGDYVICAPGQHHVPIPAGTHRIDVDATRASGSSARRSSRGRTTWPHVNRIQDRLHADAAQQVRHRLAARAAGDPQTTVKQLPGADRPGASSTSSAAAPQQFPPPAARQGGAAALRQGRHRPGHARHRRTRLSAATRSAVSRTPWPPGRSRSPPTSSGSVRPTSAGTTAICSGGFGRYGTDYKLRAVISPDRPRRRHVRADDLRHDLDRPQRAVAERLERLRAAPAGRPAGRRGLVAHRLQPAGLPDRQRPRPVPVQQTGRSSRATPTARPTSTCSPPSRRTRPRPPTGCPRAPARASRSPGGCSRRRRAGSPASSTAAGGSRRRSARSSGEARTPVALSTGGTPEP